MNNAFGEPQTILLLGGTSEIGLAIVHRLVSPATRTVVLASRRPDDSAPAVEALRREGLEVLTVAFDAADVESHQALIDDLVVRVGDLDVVIVAFGVLGDQESFNADPAAAAAAVHVNYTGAVSVCLAIATVFRSQGHGRLVVLSSVAGERTRKANYVYGSSKAGLDAFVQGLGDDLVGTGASVLVVRPGFVRSKMTTGLAPAPFATTPAAVAEVTARGLQAGRRTVWAPGILRYVFMVLRHLPGAVYRRLPLG
jgi:decaprenylphospho-beta-D-erythro-pentofuranosid-2-ulose 2-reductase